MNMTTPAPVPRLHGTGWITESWLLFRQNPAAWVLALIAVFMVMMIVTIIMELAIFVPMGVFSAFSHATSGGGTFPTLKTPFWMYPVMLIIGIGETFLQMFFYAGILKMANSAMRREPIRIEDAFSGWAKTVPLFLYHLPISLVSYAIILPMSFMSSAHSSSSVPWGLFIGYGVAGIVIALLYGFLLPGMALVVDGVPVLQAYGRSFRGVLKEVWPLTLVAIIMTVFYVLAILTCGLGWLVLWPMWAIIISLLARDACDLPAAPDQSYTLYGGQWSLTQEAAPGVWPPAPSASTPLAGPAAASKEPPAPLPELEPIDPAERPADGQSQG